MLWTLIIFKFFKYKVRLLRETVAQPVPNLKNGNLKNSSMAVSLTFLSKVWR